MAANKKLLILPGDGIGPEVMRQVGRVLDWFGKRRSAQPSMSAKGWSAAAPIDKHGTPLTDDTMAAGDGAPMRCCWAPSAGRNGTACPST